MSMNLINSRKLYENSEEKAKLPQKSTFNDNFFNQTPNYNVAKALQSSPTFYNNRRTF